MAEPKTPAPSPAAPTPKSVASGAPEAATSGRSTAPAGRPVSPGSPGSPSKAARKLKQTIVQFAHGDEDERRDAARILADMSSGGVVVCQTLLNELGNDLITALDGQHTDSECLFFVLLTLKRIAHHMPMETSDAGIAPPLVALLYSELPILRDHAAECVAILCEEDDAGKALLQAGLAPALTRLALALRESGEGGESGESGECYDGGEGGGVDGGDGGAGGAAGRDGHTPGGGSVMRCACAVLSKLAQDRDTRRMVSEAGVLHELLALSAPLLPDAGEDVRAAQRHVLTAVEALSHVAEFKALLSREPTFFPLLYAIRDSAVEGVAPLAHAIAKQWDDDFFGWAWQCCTSCKEAAAELMLDAEVPIGPADATGGVERYSAKLATVHGQLKEFLRHANEQTHGLLQLQEQLDDGVALCERYAGVLRQRFVIGSDPADAPADPDAELSAPRAFEVHNRQLSRKLESSAGEVRTTYRQLLLHCNLLLDCQRQVHRAEAQLGAPDELREPRPSHSQRTSRCPRPSHSQRASRLPRPFTQASSTNS